MDLALVNQYFQEHIPMMHNPLADFVVKNVSEYFVEKELMGSLRYVIAGSSAEGLYICSKHPDIDCMLYSAQRNLKLKPPHLKNLHDKPGFAWYIIDDDEKRIFTDCFEEDVVIEVSKNGKTFTYLNPSKFWRSGDRQKDISDLVSDKTTATSAVTTVDLNIDGPAYPVESKITILQHAFHAKVETDLVCAFELDEWPYFICKNWIFRNHMTWPSHDTAFRISRYGLSLVPKTSSYGNSNLEWRLSFSAQEKELCMELISAQKIVYKYLKFLAIEHFNKAKILHSYHLKTVFFWTLQTLPPEKKMGKSLNGRESYRFI